MEENSRNKTANVYTGTVTVSGAGLMLEFGNEGSTTFTVMPEKDGDDRSKIALFALKKDEQLEVKTDIKSSDAIKKIIEMGGTREQISMASDYFKAALSKSKSETETKIGGKVGTSGADFEVQRKKKRKN